MSYLHRLSLSTDEHVTTKLACDYAKHHCPTLPQEFSSAPSDPLDPSDLTKPIQKISGISD
jgi:hypothetical protein